MVQQAFSDKGLKTGEKKQKQKLVYHLTFIIHKHWHDIGFVTGIFGKKQTAKKILLLLLSASVLTQQKQMDWCLSEFFERTKL